MEQTLKKLHALQERAFKKGIYAFQINARVVGGEKNIWVTIFKKGDDSNGDYWSNWIQPGRNPKYILMEIADFIGEEIL